MVGLGLDGAPVCVGTGEESGCRCRCWGNSPGTEPRFPRVDAHLQDWAGDSDVGQGGPET